MKKAIIYLVLLVLSLVTILLIGCASTPEEKAQMFVGGHVKYAIEYYGEPKQILGTLKQSFPQGSKFYLFPSQPEDPQFQECVILFFVDRDGYILSKQIKCE